MIDRPRVHGPDRDDFLAWCADHNRPDNRDALADYLGERYPVR